MSSTNRSATPPTNPLCPVCQPDEPQTTICEPAEPAPKARRAWFGNTIFLRLAEYIRNVGWLLILAIIAMNVADPIGQAMGFTGALNNYPALILVLTVNPLLVAMAAHMTSWMVFFPIAVARILVGFYVDYLVGRRLAEVAESQAKEYLSHEPAKPRKWQLWKKFVAWLELWLEAKGESQHSWIMTLCAGRFFTALVPWFPGVPIYVIAGAAEVSRRKLAVISVIAAIIEVAIVHQVGMIF